MAATRVLRGRLHVRAGQLARRGHDEAAQALWVVVEELDELLIFLARRRR